MNTYNLIILAAGRGSRMQGLTEAKPKCLLELGGKTLLDWQMLSARQADFKDICIIGGYRNDTLPQEQLRFINQRWQSTNMVATLFCADALLSSEPCIVSYSDIVYRPEHLAALQNSLHSPAITYDTLWESLWRLRNEDFLADAETFQADQAGFLVTIGEKPTSVAQVQGQYMGLLKFTPEAWQGIRQVYFSLPNERQDKIDMTSFLRLLMDSDIRIEAVPVSGGWIEADTETDIKLYESAIEEAAAKGQTWSHDWRTNK